MRKITRETFTRWPLETLLGLQQAAIAGSVSAKNATAGALAKLRRGMFSVVIGLIGDSTGTDITEFFGVMVRQIAAAYPNYSLLWRPWNTTTQWYDPPTQLTWGTGNGGGDRGALLSSGQLRHAGSAQLPTNTGAQDIGIFRKIKPSVWKPGGAAAKRIIDARWQGAGSRSWAFFIDETGRLGFEWSADGTATSGTVLSTVVVPFAEGVAGWVKVLFDADNGAAGNTATFQTSTDGINWTTLGTPVVTATAATIFAGTITYSVGSRGSTPADFLDGTFYWGEVQVGITGTSIYSVVPPLLDSWDQATTSASVSYVGAPVILAVNGSASGQNTTYFDETSRRLRLNAPHGQDVTFLNTGHNESHIGFVATLLAWISAVRTRQPGVPLVGLSQNPVFYGSLFSSQAQVDQRFKRSAEYMTALAAGPTAGAYPLDVYPAYDLDEASLRKAIEDDGVHPRQDAGQGTSGSELQGKYMAQVLFEVPA